MAQPTISDTTTIDCLPILPPYSTTTSEGRPCRRTESIEHILDCESLDTRTKVCCDSNICTLCLSGCLKFRRVLFMLCTAALLSITGGVVLGAARALDSNFLTLSLMFAGLGMVLITVVVIGWRCTPPDHEPCHLLFGLGSYSMVQQRHLFSRQRNRSSRFHWFGERLFPEFRYRRPPPSYSVSIQERHQSASNLRAASTIPQTPPPAYKLYNSRRHRARKGIHMISTSNSSHINTQPPAYREEACDTVSSSMSMTTPMLSPSLLTAEQLLVGAENQAFTVHLEETASTVSQSNSDNRISSENMEVSSTCQHELDREDNSITQSASCASDNAAKIATVVAIPQDIGGATFFYDRLGDVTHL